MPYCTSTDFEQEFSAAELAQLLTGRAQGFVQTEADAAGEINSYLAGRYALPLASVPARIKAVCLDIARFRLYDDAVPEAVAERYRQAVAWLRDVARGTAILTDAAGAALPPPTDASGASQRPQASARTPVFGAGFQQRYQDVLDPTIGALPT